MSHTQLSRWFQLEERGTTVGRELRGAFATFLTMAYILFVNPIILSGAGMPADVAQSLGACTALAAGVCSILMGATSNFPIALASGMGLNAAVVGIAIKAQAIPGMHKEDAWKIAMGLIVLDGVVTLLLVLCGLREAVMNAIPKPLRLATAAGIGLFIALIGLVNAKIVIAPTALGSPPLGPGSWHNPSTAVALIGLLITVVLVARKVTGALVIGILLTTLIAFPFGVAHLPQAGASWLPTFGAAFHADVIGALKWSAMPPLHRRPPAGLVHHSDRGSQYCCDEYQQQLHDAGLVASMSRVGNCYDNAVMESFWGSFKCELVYQQPKGRFATQSEAQLKIFEYIEVFYNRQRRHSAIGYQSPEAFEASLN